MNNVEDSVPYYTVQSRLTRFSLLNCFRTLLCISHCHIDTTSASRLRFESHTTTLYQLHAGPTARCQAARVPSAWPPCAEPPTPHSSSTAYSSCISGSRTQQQQRIHPCHPASHIQAPSGGEDRIIVQRGGAGGGYPDAAAWPRGGARAHALRWHQWGVSMRRILLLMRCQGCSGAHGVTTVLPQ